MANPEHVEILKQGVEVWNKWREDQPTIFGIEKIAIKGLDLTGANFQGCFFTDCAFAKCNLSKANLSNAGLDECDLFDVNMEEVSFLETKLSSCWFVRGKGESADFYNAQLSNVEFLDCNLHRANFMNAKLEGVGYKDCKLDEIILFDADLKGVKIEGCSLARGEFDFSKSSDIVCRSSNLSGAMFDQARLEDGLFMAVVMKNASLKESELVKCKLFGVDLLLSDFRWCNLEETNLSGIKYSKSTRQKKYQGIRISSSFGQERFKRFAQDQSYIEELRNSGLVGKWIFWFWFVLADCGRSFWPWACWSAAMALAFAAIFFYGLGPESFHINSELPAAFTTMIYYSVVTFTTLGFGDLTPATTTAAWWVMAEVILGYIMLGGLISILANKLARRS